MIWSLNGINETCAILLVVVLLVVLFDIAFVCTVYSGCFMELKM